MEVWEATEERENSRRSKNCNDTKMARAAQEAEEIMGKGTRTDQIRSEVERKDGEHCTKMNRIFSETSAGVSGTSVLCPT